MLELPDIPAEERTPLVESLLALLRVQQDRIQQLEATVQQLRDEVALLKGQKPRPDIRPSLLEAPRPKAPAPDGSKRPEPRMNVDDVGRAVVYMASLPLDSNVLFMTVMANLMPFVGRG